MDLGGDLLVTHYKTDVSNILKRYFLSLPFRLLDITPRIATVGSCLKTSLRVSNTSPQNVFSWGH